ncbi:hypothetical protein ZIOFF_053430 [Zingiber officinale]|uniref:Uncharacterized protein n=1 Tax=Zingiber officinale TaxID=94328 RepID=A0A8J5FDF9_ZINOF|nr:hypothetical protein ZIOFF_053430 [Zingiber officinale]
MEAFSFACHLGQQPSPPCFPLDDSLLIFPRCKAFALRCFTSSSLCTLALNSRVFIGYSIYKGKTTLTVDPRAPEFTPLEFGAYYVSKEGFTLLQFAPVVGTQQYDWSRKQVFQIVFLSFSMCDCNVMTLR